MEKYKCIGDGNPFLPKGCVVEAFKLTKEFIADTKYNINSKEKFFRIDIIFGKLDIRLDDSDDSILLLNIAGLGQHQRVKVENEFGGIWFLRNIETNSTHCPFETEFQLDFKKTTN